MPGHYGDKKKKKRAPKPPKPAEPPKAQPALAAPQNRRTGEDYLAMEARRKKKKK